MSKIGIAAVAFRAGQPSGFKDFAAHVERLFDQALAHKPDLILYPEILTTELMAAYPDPNPLKMFESVDAHTGDYLQLFSGLASGSGVSVLGGTHIKKSDGKFYNAAHLFSPDGSVIEQRKLHLIPDESRVVTPGTGVDVFEFKQTKAAMLTCYDLEFPEPPRLAALKGAELILSPSATVGAAGYWRVRHSAQARCIENQVYVAHGCFLGTTPLGTFDGMPSILGPCDKGFPDNGCLVQGEWNHEGVVFAEVDLNLLRENRQTGSVTPLRDRRYDLLDAIYQLEAKREGKVIAVQPH